MPEMRDVYSSVASQVGYDAETRELRVRWSRGGKVSVYSDVPPELGVDLHKQASIGEALRGVKEKYPHRYAEGNEE